LHRQKALFFYAGLLCEQLLRTLLKVAIAALYLKNLVADLGTL